MTLPILRSYQRKLSVATMLAVLIGLCGVAGAATDKKATTPAPAKPAAQAAKPATAARPAGGAAGGAAHGPTTAGAAGSHGPTANGAASHGPTANGGGTTASHGPTANAPTANGAHTPATTTSTNSTRTPPTAGGARTPGESTGAHPGGGVGAGAHGGGPTSTHPSAIKSGPAPRGSTEHVARNGSAVRMRPGGRVSDVHDAKRGMDIHHGLAGGRRVSVERRDGSRLVAERGRPGYVQRGYSYHGHDFGRRAYYYHGHEYNRFYRGYGYRGVYLNVYAPGVYYGPGFYGWAYNPWAAPIAFGWGWAGNPWFGFYGGYFQPYPVYPSAAFWLTDYIISQDLQAAYAARAAADAGAAAVPVEAGSLGTEWDENESGFSGTWTRRGTSNVFDASWNGGAITAVLSMSTNGADVSIQRRNSSDGNECDYRGTLAPDGTGAAGTYKCTNGYRGVPWRASIQGAGVPSDNATPLSPDVKQQIADEVKAQLALENQEATQTAQHQDVDAGSSGIARMLADVQNGHPHVFVAGDNVDVVDANSGQECAISDGDALLLQSAPAADATAVNLVVLASKGGVECHKSTTVTVQLADLQEMQNHMRETIDQGLQDLQAKQGTGGLPQAPPSAQTKPTQAEYAQIAPPPDPKDEADIQQQGQQADQAEKEVTADASQDSGVAPTTSPAPPAAPAQTASVEMGQTTDQVQAALGAPARVANLGPKVIYYYNGMKVIFKDGKVSDVQ